MKIKLILFICIALLTSCETDFSPEASVIESSISKASNDNASNIPFADSTSLAAFKTDKSILNYNFARKLALIELEGSDFKSDMNWKGCGLSNKPVLIYGFDSKPKYYEFIVKDAENKSIGTVTVNARKLCSV